MILKTARLVLREWREEDAKELYKYAKDPRIGPMAGWPVHTSIENSRQIIKEVLLKDESYAITLKDKDLVIGSIRLMIGCKSNLNIKADEGEIGYWIGVPYWRQGLIPEAVEEIIRHGFEDLNLQKIWSAYFEGNEKSKRVQEKCGFLYHHTEKDKEWALLNDVKTEHITCITRDKYYKYE